MGEKKNVALDLLATRLSAEEAEAFRLLAKSKNTTVSRMLSDYVRKSIADETREENPTGSNVAVLTYKNVDRLKHEVAFHNPNHLNPDRMLNYILNRYFEFVEEVRK